MSLAEGQSPAGWQMAGRGCSRQVSGFSEEMPGHQGRGWRERGQEVAVGCDSAG